MNTLVVPPAQAPVAVAVGSGSRPAGRRWDPRLFQIATLGGLLGYGVHGLGLDVEPGIAVVILATVLVTQLVGILASAGGLVVNRAARADVTWAFLAAHTAFLLGRTLWLGDPLAIPLHRLANGALVLFAFFMISDPRTTPDSRPGRILFAILVAAG